MPKIVINERDYTSPIDKVLLENIVYIPGKKKADAAVNAPTLPVLCKSVKEFEDTFGTFIDDTEISKTIALKLLNKGLYVLYELVADTENLTGVFDKLEDKMLYEVRFITAGGHCKTTLYAEMATVCKNRGDCVALLDVEGKDNTPANDTIKGALETAFKDKEDLGSFAALFSPWCTFGEDLLPGSVAYLLAYADAVKSYPTWFASAGVVRGTIADITSLKTVYGQKDIDVLQPKTNGYACNTICNIRNYGIKVWGNRTCLPIGEKLKATNFLNVRQLIIELKKTLYNSSIVSTFEQNSDVLWINFKNLITPLLDRMLSGQGINGYKITKIDTDEKATLKAKIRIIPIEGVEYFDLTVELTDSLEVEVTEE